MIHYFSGGGGAQKNNGLTPLTKLMCWTSQYNRCTCLCSWLVRTELGLFKIKVMLYLLFNYVLLLGCVVNMSSVASKTTVSSLFLYYGKSYSVIVIRMPFSGNCLYVIALFYIKCYIFSINMKESGPFSMYQLIYKL